MDSLHKAGISDCGKILSNLEYSLKIGPRRFADRLIKF